MSETGQGEGWWQASDGKWYPPQQHPDYQAEATQAMPPAEPPTAAMPPVGPPPAGPPPGAPGAASSNAKWIIVGVLGVAAIAIAAFLLTRDDGKKNDLATSSSASPSSSSSTSSSSTSSSSTSSSPSSSSSSSSGPSAAQIQARLLKASDIGSNFSDETFTPDNTSPSPCGQPNASTKFPPTIDVGSEAVGSGAFFLEEVSVYKDAPTAANAFAAGKQGVSCTQGTTNSEGAPVEFSSPIDRSDELGVPEAVEIDFRTEKSQGQFFAIHSDDAIVIFQFQANTPVDSSQLPDALTIVKKGLAKLSG